MSADGPYVPHGRCKSGKRWFWYAAVANWREDWPSCDDPVCHDGLHPHRYGWEGTEQAALLAVNAAVREFGGVPNCRADNPHAGTASKALRRINAARRAARPYAGTEPNGAPVEYLWGEQGGRPVQYPITRKTAKRIYYVRSDVDRGYGDGPRIGYVDREAIERDGKVTRKSGEWWYDDWELFATEEAAMASIPARETTITEPVDLKELKQAMADAHPDRGGTREEFTAARLAYQQARGQRMRAAS